MLSEVWERKKPSISSNLLGRGRGFSKMRKCCEEKPCGKNNRCKRHEKDN